MRASTQKGNQYEKEVRDILTSWGWKAEGQHRKVGFLGPGKMIMMGRDVFGSDIIAKKKGQPTKWIQVGTLSNKTNKCKQIEDEPWTFEHDNVEVWLRIPKKKRFLVLLWTESGWISSGQEVDYNKEIKNNGR